MLVECPSGLVVEVRKLRGSEADILADRKKAAKGETIDAILIACTTETKDVGPYSMMGAQVGAGPLPWSKILVADRFVTLMAIRVATYGPEYDFPVKCGGDGPNPRGCGHHFHWEIDLSEDLEVFDLPPASRAKIAADDNRFETSIDGRRHVFKLQTGEGEKRAGKIVEENPRAAMTTALGTRLLEVDGVEKNGIPAYLKAMDLDLQLQLMGAMDEADGGVETQIEIECEKCQKRTDINLPFEGGDFWLPRSSKKPKSDTSEATPKRTGRKLGATSK